MSKIKNLLYYFLIAIVFTSIGWSGNTAWHLPKSENNPISQVKPRPLEKYSFENLSKAEINSASIEIGEKLKEDPKFTQAPSDGAGFTSYLFSYSFDPTLRQGSGQALKKVTGVINIPIGDGPFPVVVMFRGFVDQKLYKSGDGTRRAGEFFAQNGFITIAPDFLGYGGSDPEAPDIFESRFQTYTTALALLRSLDPLKEAPLKAEEKTVNIEASNIFLWGHSNGGQIALAILEITGKPYPTVLWAPNSAKFPYSILYYLDEASDEGKLIITKLADFMNDYDVKNYSIRNYFEKIDTETKIQVHQGLSDDAVPVVWTNSLVKSLLNLSLDLDYFKYPGADHNLSPSWNEAVAKSVTFYKNALE